jgi:hypothetical protein
MGETPKFNPPSLTTFFGRLANYGAVWLLVLLTINGLIGDYTLNPIFDLFFARTHGMVFNNVHVSSILGICLVCWYQIVVALRSKSPAIIQAYRPYKWVLVIFASASWHELVIYLWNLILKGGESQVPFQDYTWYVGFIVLGAIFATPKQRKYLLVIGLYTTALMGIYVGFFSNSDVLTAGPQFVADTFMEVGGWLAVALGWLVFSPWTKSKIATTNSHAEWDF